MTGTISFAAEVKVGGLAWMRLVFGRQVNRVNQYCREWLAINSSSDLLFFGSVSNGHTLRGAPVFEAGSYLLVLLFGITLTVKIYHCFALKVCSECRTI